METFAFGQVILIQSMSSVTVGFSISNAYTVYKVHIQITIVYIHITITADSFTGYISLRMI